MKSLSTRYPGWCLITGASAGIGEQFARRLAKENMNLVLVARRIERLINLKTELETKYNIQVLPIQLDLAGEDFLDELIEKIGDKHVSILINNAGFGLRGEFVNSSIGRQTDMIKVNCIAPLKLTHHFIKPMIEKNNGAVIFLGSLVAFQSTPSMTTYSATKAFNLFLGEALWYELRKYNIDVLALNPGGTKTEFQQIAGSTTGPFPRTVEQVVGTAMQALGKKVSVVDGRTNKFLVLGSKILPRRVVVKLAGRISESLYRKN